MKYIKLFENFDSYDPYELMMIPPNKKAELIMWEIKSDKPNLNLVSDLIVLGANVDWQIVENSTLLHQAAMYGRTEIARMLIDAGADLDVKYDYDGWTALHWAVYYGEVEIARMLIDAGADVNAHDNGDRTPLHRAARRGRVEIASMLLDAGSRKDIQDNKGNLPYDLARTPELKNILRP
jgi:ankyrin repeat protein